MDGHKDNLVIVKLIFRFLLLQKLKTLLKKPARRKVNIKLTRTKHLSCQARINGFKAKLLIDTGASNSCIAIAQKDFFDLKEKGDPFEAAGAGKDKMKAIQSHKCNLILGRHLVGKHAFVLLDMQHINTTLIKEGGKAIDGILGNDFLVKYKVIIDYEKKLITL